MWPVGQWIELRSRAGQECTLPPCPLSTGDVVLLFTDGLFEVTGADSLEQYGQQRLLAAARQHMNLPPAELCDALIAGVRAFAGEVTFSDDVCLLSLEVARLDSGRGPALAKGKKARS